MSNFRDFLFYLPNNAFLGDKHELAIWHLHLGLQSMGEKHELAIIRRPPSPMCVYDSLTRR